MSAIPIAIGMGFCFWTEKEKTKQKEFAMCAAESGQRANSPTAVADGVPRTVHSSTVVRQLKKTS
ncbi:hypothetical protein B4Q04_21445 [Zobellia sp. OII3]|nr:hypothetical protein B4Q04_21445 [Zobellia sp. OII3]